MTANHFTVLYFAALAERAGQTAETLPVTGDDLATLYEQLRARYDFPPPAQLRVARNQQFCAWTECPAAGDEIAFIPPVAGG